MDREMYPTGSVVGTVGARQVSFAGATVNQPVIFVPKKGMSSGWDIVAGITPTCLVGLGMPADNSQPTFMASLRNQAHVQYFSLAVPRSNDGLGELVLNDLPGPSIKYDREHSAIAKMTQHPFRYRVAGRPYTIDIDGFGVLGDNSMNSGIKEVMIDPGANYLYVPPATALAIIAKWPGKLTQETSYNATRWKVSCTDKPPSVGVKIGGTVLEIEGKDMIVDEQTEHACFAAVAVQQGDGGPMIGIPFLVNVVAVYDVAAEEMRFHQRRR
jgi:hypothetical protein